MRVNITDPADADLQEAFEYIVPRNPEAAYRLVVDLEAFWEGTLAKYPTIGRRVRENVRVFYKRGYRIYYYIGEEQIDILRIIHMARDDYEI